MPYWRLSGYYFFYFASLGALVPFWGLYLQADGFDALAIGQLMAILSATKIVAPMLWGHVADRTGRRIRLVQLGSLLSLLGFLCVFVVEGFWGMALALLLFSFFWNASLPQMEAITFNHLRARPTGYALVRVWGSVGFILVVVGLGAFVEHGSLESVPVWVLFLVLGIFATTLVIPDNASAAGDRASPSLRDLLSRPEVLVFFAACFLMQFSHGIYYAFYSIHLESAGYSSAAVGQLWALGVIAEVIVFLVMHRLLERFGARRVVLWSLGLAVVRWWAIGAFVDILFIQIGAQLLHAATFGTFHAAAIHLVHHLFPGRTQGRGQALYNSISFGAGGAAGSLIGGVLWAGSGPLVTFGVGALVSALGFFILWRWTRESFGQGA
ncbi:major facilitator superfamily MFS_1 [Thiorhodococcus drewsii AZ1]|uniref:Major facilitator superfamily MFS_1 n=1 Tax=Thiorhodococcus drewsii AZ1 TaxID=765913 RepID=G2E0K9_9GAMM|nr:MFS transporter [Thiorhodococcus drewsii]EGV31631.1 major facilitator superfamily MFS_1 [Thiorhodococcus drewsii AZ1]